MSIKKKLILIFILIIVIPNSIIGVFSYYYFSEALTDKVIKNVNRNNEQISKNIDSYIVSLVKLTEFPNINAEMNNILRKNYIQNDSGAVEKMQDLITARGVLYRGIIYLNNLIDSVLLVPENSEFLYYSGIEGVLNSEVNIKNELWYKDILKAEGKDVVIGVHRDKVLTKLGDYVVSVTRNIVNPYTKESLGVVVINTKVTNLSNLWRDIPITANSKMFIVDNEERIINCDDKNDIGKSITEISELSSLEVSEGLHEKKLKDKEYYVNVTKSEYTNWKIISLIPKTEMLKEIYYIRNIVIIVSLVLVAIILIISTLLATGITKPILRLKNTMKLVENGNLQVRAEISGGEIGELGITFNKMIDEMNNLIGKIYNEEKDKRNAELSALQAQISPHFLYNTLNTIKWMANIQGSKGIVNSLTSLIELLTFSAKVKDQYITIAQELDQLQHYLNIQRLRYYDKFDVEIEASDKVKEFATLKFLLQPIVENSILHGFNKKEGVGLIKIKIDLDGDRIIYDIHDNGRGLSETEIQDLFENKSFTTDKRFNKIGIFNVNQRIKMEFGNKYGITVQSEIGCYTNVHVEIPVIEIDNKKGQVIQP